MSANLNGDTQSYQPFATRIFQGLKADVVAIQEFNYSDNSAASLRSFVDTAFGTNFNYFRESGANYSIPNGIITRFPMTASGTWSDPSVNNRGFAWARLALTPTNDLYVVSVHFLTSNSTDRNAEANDLKSYIQTNFPAGAWIVVAGDLNTDGRNESTMITLGSFVSDSPIPTDAESGGNSFTSMNRNTTHDYVLPSFSFTNRMSSSVFPSHSFSNGLVFDSRVYVPLTDVPPILSADSGNAQHMAVLKDFSIPASGTNPVAPLVTLQPQGQTVTQGSTVGFSVTTSGTQPFSYQWRFNGAPISLATNETYSITNVLPAQAGDYSVVITNVAGSTVSSNATLTVQSSPAISAQPQNQSVAAGQSATFTVTANGAPTLAYQWRFFSTNLPGATSSSFTRASVQPGDVGPYSVVITNSYGSVTSIDATLIVFTGSQSVIAQWNFNSPIPDGTNVTGTTSPSVGSGTAVVVGSLSTAFVSGSTTDPVSPGSDNSAWNTSTYPAQGTGNKTAGVRFNVSTVGLQNILVNWDMRASNTGSKYSRLQYTIDGTTFVDFPTANALSGANFESKTNNLAAITSVNNKPNFGFRIVAEFESTAANTANTNYVGANGTYGTGGTVRFDMVTISGSAMNSSNPPPAAVLGTPHFINQQIQFAITGQSGASYIVQATTNINLANWISLQTNSSPFLFTDTNSSLFDQRFYRAQSAQ